MDLSQTFATWCDILDPRFAELRAVAAEHAPTFDPATVQRLRRTYSASEVAVALELATARQRAARKFDAPTRLLADVEGVAQASGANVARHKAARFAGASRVEDLCCGIGGDAMALAAAGCSVVGVDREPARARMAEHNAGIETAVVDVAERDVSDCWVHIDPARRAAGARLWRYEDCLPGPESVEPLLQSAKGGALKLGPGVDWDSIPDASRRECEVIGDRSGLLQAVVWCGDAVRAAGQHTATVLHGEEVCSFTAAPTRRLNVAYQPGRFLVIPAAALERAQLVVGRLAALGDRPPVAELARDLGWLTSDTAVVDPPWFSSHEILVRLPWRVRRLRAWLSAHDGGSVVVRSRGGAVNTDRTQKELRGEGGTSYTIFGVREGKQVVGYITPSD